MSTAAPPQEAPVAMAERIFAIVETCARSGRALTLAELTASTGLPKSSLHRICAQMVALGALEPAGDGFQVGAKMFALGSLNPDLRRLRVISMPYLHELVAHSGWVANMAILCEGRALLVEEVFGPKPALPKLIGATLPLHATALGKALLAGQPPGRAEQLISELTLHRFTKRTIVRKSVLRSQVAAIAAGEVAVSREEWRLGTAAVAAPVLVEGGADAALALIGPSGERGIERMRGVVRAAARDLAAALAPAGAEPAAAPGERFAGASS